MEKNRREISLRWSDNGGGAGSSSKGLEIFQKVYGNDNYKEMINQIRDACSKLDTKYSSILMYCVLTGLRPTEACASMHLLKERKDEYFDPNRNVLEHFRFPEVFMRRTKNAYISNNIPLFQCFEGLGHPRISSFG